MDAAVASLVDTPVPTRPPTDAVPDRPVDTILAELDAPYDGTLPVAALREVQRRRDEFVPHLVGLLRRATERTRQGEEIDGNGHFFAMLLLAEFGAVEALPAIVEAISLPDDGPDALFGDTITDGLEQILARFAGPDAELLDRVIADRSVVEYVRNAAIQAYVLLVRDGQFTCGDAVRRLQGHLRAATAVADDADDWFADPSNMVVTWLINGLCDLDTQPALDDIREAYDRDLVDRFVVSMDNVERTIAEGEAGLRGRLSKLPPSGIPDTVAELEGWAAYAPNDEPHDEPAGPWSLDDLSEDEFAGLWNQAKRDVVREYAPQDAPDPYAPETVAPIRNEGPKVGRNDPCPCGSGKKYKKCCGGRG
jgi:hypothetical protein